VHPFGNSIGYVSFWKFCADCFKNLKELETASKGSRSDTRYGILRYLLILVRLLSLEEMTKMGFKQGINFIKIITARDMNKSQRKMYNQKRGIK